MTLELIYFWSKAGESQSAPLDFDPPLCFEGDGDRKARADGYALLTGRLIFLIEDIFGYPLHDCAVSRVILSSHVVIEIAAEMENYVAEPWRGFPAEQVGPVVRDLARLCRAYGEAGYDMYGRFV
jgi:hypothetical protein